MTLRQNPAATRIRGLLGVGAALTLAVAISGCASSVTPAAKGQGQQPKGGDASQVSAPEVSKADIEANIVNHDSGVKVSRTVKVNVADGTFKHVVVRSHKQRIDGTLSASGTRWHSTDKLQPGRKYVVRSKAVDANGLVKRYRSSFRTQDLTLDDQTYPSFTPLEGSTVGVAMPVIVKFDVPVTNKASIERHLHVTTKPAQVGAWHWMSDNEVHWRPKHYWQPGTQVTVNADIDSVPAGNGIYGQLSRTDHFTIGRNQVTTVNIATDQLKVYRDGGLVRTIPVTTGKQPDYTTRSGVKVIVAKLRHTRMNSETIGIDPNSAEGYDLSDVEYAMRITYSGEFLHAAPWSVAYQGNSNVSHGCTGMSTANAAWLYNSSLVGDPVVFTGSDRGMTLDNGYGDWNESFKEYKQGSALH
jgi:lipoprotein-anchoring transpeptidase ErfK/SrfK